MARHVALCLVLLVGVAHADRGEHEEYRDPEVMEVGPFLNVHDHPAKLVIRGRVQSGYRFSEALLVRPNGSAVVVRDVDADRERGEFHVPLTLDRGKGIYRLELTARTGQDRTHSGARILLFAGVPADHPDDPVPEDVTPDPRIPAEVLAAELFDRVNAHRTSLGLAPVEWFEPLALVARRHAEDCVKLKKLDHRVNDDGTVVTRMESAYGWTRLAYQRPGEPPTKSEDAQSFFPTIVEARRGLEPILHRWQRFAAFCVPMTSDLVTHAACGIARAPGGTCYIVFTFAQVNGTVIPKDAKRMLEQARRDVKHASDADRPERLRALGLWRDKAGLAEARKHLRAKDAALRAAALDVLLLDDPVRVAAEIERELAEARREFERLVASPGKPAQRHHDVAETARRVTYAPRLADLADEVLALRRSAAARALEAALAAPDEPAKRKALEAVVRDFPGTEAATEALAHL